MTMPQPDTPCECPRIVLASPNLSRRMGGEALKALSVFLGYRELGFDVTQVTHARVRGELTAYGIDSGVIYVKDGPLQRGLDRYRLHWLLGLVDSWLLHRAVQREVDRVQPWIVHFTAPIAPSGISFPIRGAPVVIGPLNGSILHPPTLMFRESWTKRLGAMLTRPVQLSSRVLFRGKLQARLFVSGGERTARTLELGGCRRDRMVTVINSGVDPRLRDHRRIVHQSQNWNFVFLGRLVRYKACDLVIRALARVPQARLEVIGDGPESRRLRELALRQVVSSRLVFKPYSTDREALFAHLRQFRGFLFPTLAEASGTVIQEAMMLGLPAVCVDWGGPQMLLDAQTGILIPPESEEAIVKGLANAMTRLARDPDFAETLSIKARHKAETVGYDWPRVLRSWIALYDRLFEESGSTRRFATFLAMRTGGDILSSILSNLG
ncbi:glycosyltransferase involved in cell wall biosynthesis [Novosphingobium sp. PhB55]|uniref:glycosyltransferase family 4 protein n=1 Tax=Novosphingobium sp. PhB55 TaxID=2485106 RepID=UPI001065E36A|nr:glycosyltransferase family 4 protein [Novosphingobium sp. PhB55]TDW61726.1 glycosyltransferase involved in cell wall biosynthesis [Novosphingobium sp. PhB55]